MDDDTLAQAKRQNEVLKRTIQSLATTTRGTPKKGDEYVGIERLAKNSEGELLGTEKSNFEQRNRLFKKDYNRSHFSDDKEPREQGNYKGEKKTSGSLLVHANDKSTASDRRSAMQNTQENYFDDLRKKVNRIREYKNDVKISGLDNTEQNSKFKEHELPTSSRRTVESPPDRSKQTLISKIERQNLRIEELEVQVRRLSLQNRELSESQHVLRAKVKIDEKERAKSELVNSEKDPQNSFNFREFEGISDTNKMSHNTIENLVARRNSEAEEDDRLRKENARLRVRVQEIAKRSQLLVSIYRHRIDNLAGKLETSHDIARYFWDSKQFIEPVEDSTEELLYGYREDTTMQLIRGSVSASPSLNRESVKNVRAYLLVVLFVVKLRTATNAEKAWREHITP